MASPRELWKAEISKLRGLLKRWMSEAREKVSDKLVSDTLGELVDEAPPTHCVNCGSINIDVVQCDACGRWGCHYCFDAASGDMWLCRRCIGESLRIDDEWDANRDFDEGDH